MHIANYCNLNKLLMQKECVDMTWIKYENPFTKHYFEEYARLVLNDLLNLSLIHRKDRYGQDKPDLISNSEELGVEVTHALSDEGGRQNKLFQQNYPKENRNQILVAEAKRLKVKGLSFIDNVACLSQSCSKDYNINLLISTIEKKLKKLNSITFNKYTNNQLFVSAFSFFPEDIEFFLNNFSNLVSSHPTNFDTIYIFNMEGLYVFCNNQYRCIPIPENSLTRYKHEAMSVSEHNK